MNDWRKFDYGYTMDLINTLSNHLFWDVDKTLINTQKHKKYITTRVLQHGTFEDWKILKTLWFEQNC